ncbi:SGNH/GDSL hydrolase family protein [Aeromicrobium sp. HA]|uniref:SGNH/GDSL hydrolase family protein n=1 Tax=Aeromicrobium sp. HA TaxID=3009077 RepID=UPI0022AF1E4C|nr:SGNH/GDSL hydrolase family protein [Aeromicrobium sp. HA]
MLTTARNSLNAAAAGTGVSRWLWVGDSFVEGEGASTLANTFRMRTVASTRTLRSISGAALGLIPGRTYYTYLSASASWRAPSSGTATATPNWNISQGTKGIRFTATGQYREWSVTGTAIDVLYLQAGGAGGGNLTVARNGTTVATINANDSGQPYQPSKPYRITFPSRGTYTIRVTSGSTQGIVDGLVVYDGDDTGGGIIAYDCSRTGAQSNLIAVDDIINGWTAIQPHLVIDDQVGSNDFLDAARSPSDVVGFLNTRLNAYAALASSPSVVILVPWRLAATAGTNALGFTYEQYVTAVKNACAAHSYSGSIRVLDLQDVYPTASSQAWHDADGLHPNNTGHQQIANALVSFIDTLGVNPAAGAVVGTTTTSGSVTSRTAASAVVAGTSGASGGVAARRAAFALAAAVTTVAGTATTLLPSTGQADATSGVSGEVTVTRATSGAVAATTNVSGSASPTGGFAGSVAGASSAVGAVTSRSAVTGTTAGSTAVIGTAELVAGPEDLGGMVAAQSAAVGAVTVRRAASGTVTGSSAISGSATLVDVPDIWPAAGTVIGSTAVTGSATIRGATSIRVLSVTRHARTVSIERRARTVTITQEAQ